MKDRLPAIQGVTLDPSADLCSRRLRKVLGERLEGLVFALPEKKTEKDFKARHFGDSLAPV